MDEHLASDYTRKCNTIVRVQEKETDKREKPNNQCDYSFSEAGNLSRYLKTHSGEKSNKCNQCDFACTDRSSLWRHFKTHRGEKLNKCNQCDFMSCRADNLRTHLKNQTNAANVTMHPHTHII